MHSSLTRLVLTAVLAVGILCVPAFAQKYELNPYVGGQFFSDWKTVSLKNPAFYGLRGGVFVSDNVELQGNGAFINQFNLRGYNYSTNAVLYEVAGTYNFFTAKKAGVFPYGTFGIGGTTVNTSNPLNVLGSKNDAVYVVPLTHPDYSVSPLFPRTSTALVIRDGATFFNFSYGGGIKAQHVAGPMGFQFDFRGRTMPNFYGQALNAFETSGGLLFSWGER